MSDKNFMSYEDAEEVLTAYAGSIKRNRFTNKTYEQWLAMTEEERETGKYLVSGVPNADGNVAINGMVKLWENPNPTDPNGFESQAVALSDDYTNYDLIFSDVLHTYNSSYVYSTITKPVVGYRDQICLADSNTNKGICNLRRPIQFNSNTKQITWGSGTYQYSTDTTQTTDNGYMVPRVIYGIKLNHTLTIDAIARDVSTSADKCMLGNEITSVDNAIQTLENNSVKNLIVYPFTLYSRNQYMNGIYFYDSGDGTISASGTLAEGASAYYYMHDRDNTSPIILPNGKYKLTGCPSGGGDASYRICVLTTKNGAASVYGYDEGSGLEFEVNGDDYSSNSAHIGVIVFVYKTIGDNSITFRPMIRRAEIKDDTYQPYALSNTELTYAIRNNHREDSYMPFIAVADLYKDSGSAHTQSHTGYIKITFPIKRSWGTIYSDTMMKFTLDIWSYAKSTAQYQIAGYPYDSGAWINCIACSWGAISSSASAAYKINNLPVHYGNDGTNLCIWVGNANTIWSYPHIVMRDGMIGFNSYNADSFFRGTTITFVNTINGTVDVTIDT